MTHLCTGYVLRLFETGINQFLMIDSLWVLLLSVSTVGYGDIYPITDAGRTVLIMNQILGVLVLSTLVAVVQSKLSLSYRYVHVTFSRALYHDA
jgi:voltage-gated potassium channel